MGHMETFSEEMAVDVRHFAVRQFASRQKALKRPHNVSIRYSSFSSERSARARKSWDSPVWLEPCGDKLYQTLLAVREAFGVFPQKRRNKQKPSEQLQSVLLVSGGVKTVLPLGRAERPCYVKYKHQNINIKIAYK